MEKRELHNRSELDAYLNHLRRKNYSARTLDVYGYALEQLLSFLAASGVERLQDTRREHLDAYRLHLVERKLTESSLESFMRSARQFFHWLEDRQTIFDNPARGLIAGAVLKLPKSVGLKVDVLPMSMVPGES
jgi:site-specific recombinase XerC